MLILHVDCVTQVSPDTFVDSPVHHGSLATPLTFVSGVQPLKLH